MTAKRWFIVEHTFAAVLLVVAFATACGPSTDETNPSAPTGWEPVTDRFHPQASYSSIRMFRYPVAGGWMYVTMSGQGGLASSFVPNAK